MEKQEFQNNDKVDDTMSGGGKPKENKEKLSFWKRVWNWIKNLLGIG